MCNLLGRSVGCPAHIVEASHRVSGALVIEWQQATAGCLAVFFAISSIVYGIKRLVRGSSSTPIDQCCEQRQEGRALSLVERWVAVKRRTLLGSLLVNLIADVGQGAQIIGRQLKDHATAKKHIVAARQFHGALAET